MLLQFHLVVQEIASLIPKQQLCESILYIYVCIEIKLKEAWRRKRELAVDYEKWMTNW